MENQLQRGLKERHITLIALGSAIGVGLFLGSSSSIKLAGPGIMLSYLFCGIILFFILRALGEMAVHHPVAGSFSQYANDYLGNLAGYITGWNYWFVWVITCMTELTAVGIYMEFWFPEVPRWIWILAALIIMMSFNFLQVSAYGELEFWFALIKIIAIIFMIIIGLAMILFGFGNNGVPTGISNLWEHGGFLPNGLEGVLMSFQMVMFAFLGIEMIGVTAGEAKDPEKTLPRAINSTLLRILIFYVGALFVILSIYPWNEIGTSGSPFVLTFDKIGIPAAAGIINFVVLTAALSSCNTGIFSSGRMLYNLSHNGQAPKAFGTLNKKGVPFRGVMVTSAVLLFGVLLNYLVPAKVFTWIASISTFGALLTWFIILLAQWRFRKSITPEQQKNIKFKTPLYPLSTFIAGAFLIFVAILLGYYPDTRIALIVGPLWVAILVIAYYAANLNKRQNEAEVKET
ncbi:amino acid permease [Aeribacillus sp. FSL K6-1121]|jgi:Gamma-aminobutyrate permease and related permeases|uniref:amino acid permease n=1 Tax=Aeribacillus TaxID=1055323 RepID=UPI0028712196|nr:amino acid permease [Aeribacillus pallidus]MDR9797487.1 amino acid permease [Aeribacillus pallidus]MED1440973.1 amino acid permease [Aeribacillus composti]